MLAMTGARRARAARRRSSSTRPSARRAAGITVDARAAGLGAAIVAILARAPMIVVMLIAAAVTAGVRAFS